jgi:hypothetical protein
VCAFDLGCIIVIEANSAKPHIVWENYEK